MIGAADKRFGIGNHRVQPFQMIGGFLDVKLERLVIVTFLRELTIRAVRIAADGGAGLDMAPGKNQPASCL